MKTIVVPLALVLATLIGQARAADTCPALPNNSDMEWGHQSEGPDFEVCYATLKGSKTIVFGIYLGNFPSFDAKKGTSLGEGKIGGRSITWYRMSGTSNPASLSRQALLMLNEKEGYVAHVWVYANTTQELESRLSVLQHITFNK